MLIKFQTNSHNILLRDRGVSKISLMPLPSTMAGIPAHFTQLKPFADKLRRSESDWQNFVRASTYSHEGTSRFWDIRSKVIALRTPISVEGRQIKALRLKGVCPYIRQGSMVERYSSGLGAVKKFLEPSGEGEIVVRRITDGPENGARGTMTLSSLEREINTAHAVGPGRTDMVLGFGTYENIAFNGDDVGYVVYGMEEERDLRVHTFLARTPESAQDIKSVITSMGEQLRHFHTAVKHVHVYPHMGNFRKTGDNRARILDLDAARPLVSIPQAARAGFIYLDLAKLMMKFYRTMYSCVPVNLALAYALSGYFHEENKHPFMKMVNMALDKKLPRKKEDALFGRMGSERRGNTYEIFPTLVHPLDLLSVLNDGDILDLKDIRGYKNVKLLLDLVEKTAREIHP